MEDSRNSAGEDAGLRLLKADGAFCFSFENEVN